MDTLPHTSRIQVGGFSHLLGSHPFACASDFLREGLADEDSRQFSDSIGRLALQCETVVAGLRASRHRDHAAPLLMDMLTVLRDHQAMVAALGETWRGLYEYTPYLKSLAHLRVLIGQWLLHTDPWDGSVGVTADDFHHAAWRVLGEGTLLVDMYEHWQHPRAAGAGGRL